MSTTLVFAEETLQECYEDGKVLLEQHWREIEGDKFFLNPDMNIYRTIEKAGKLLIITARADGKLVGYVIWFMLHNPHYKHVLSAESDIHFLLPEYRRGWAGYHLLKTAVRYAAARGAKFIKLREKLGHEHPAIMKRLGFVPTDLSYCRVIGD